MKYLTLREAAEILGVSRDTVQRRVADGSLPAHRTSPGTGWWRVSLDDLCDFVAEQHRAARVELGLEPDAQEPGE